MTPILMQIDILRNYNHQRERGRAVCGGTIMRDETEVRLVDTDWQSRGELPHGLPSTTPSHTPTNTLPHMTLTVLKIIKPILPNLRSV
jgi:hypothetical protein